MKRCELVPGCASSLHVPYMLASCEAKESGNKWFGKEFTLGIDA